MRTKRRKKEESASQHGKVGSAEGEHVIKLPGKKTSRERRFFLISAVSKCEALTAYTEEKCDARHLIEELHYGVQAQPARPLRKGRNPFLGSFQASAEKNGKRR